MGEAIETAVGSDSAFNHEYILHFPDRLLMEAWLKTGVPDEATRALYRGKELKLDEKLEDTIRWFVGERLLHDGKRSVFVGQIPLARMMPEEEAVETAKALFQRVVSGAFAGGFGRALVKTPLVTLRSSVAYGRFSFVLDRDLPILGPDLGLFYALWLEHWASRFGRELKITSFRLVAVDPSVKGETTQLTDHAGRVIREVEGREFPLPNELLVYEEDEEEKDPGNETGDLNAITLPSAGYDLYFLMDVKVPKEEAGGEKMAGFGRVGVYDGTGEPVHVESEPLVVMPGQSRTATMRLRVGYDDTGKVVDPQAREEADPEKRPGWIHSLCRVEVAGAFLSTTRGTRQEHVIVDAAGVSGYQMDVLSGTLRSEESEAPLEAEAAAQIAKHEISILAPEMVHRDLYAHLQLARGEDPVAKITNAKNNGAGDLRHQHGITHLCCQMDALTSLIEGFPIQRTHRGKILTKEIFQTLIRQILRNPEFAADLAQIRALLTEARRHGFLVTFMVDAARWETLDADLQEDYFRVLSILIEVAAFGLDTASAIAIERPEALRDQARLRVAEMLLDGEVPLFFVSESGAPTTQPVAVGRMQVPLIYDGRTQADGKTPVAVPDLLKGLKQDRQQAAATHRRPGPALLSMDQLDEAGRKKADPKEMTAQIQSAAADPGWLARIISQPLLYTTQPHRIATKFLGLRRVAPIFTGLVHPLAQYWRPREDWVGSLTVRLRGLDTDDPLQAVLRKSEGNLLIPGQSDLRTLFDDEEQRRVLEELKSNKTLTGKERKQLEELLERLRHAGVSVGLTNMIPGNYMSLTELRSPTWGRTPPGEDRTNVVPMAIVDGHTPPPTSSTTASSVVRRHPLNTGRTKKHRGDPGEPVAAKIALPLAAGKHELVRVALDETGQHRVVEIRGRKLHLARDANGDFTYWVEGQARPTQPNLLKPRAEGKVSEALLDLKLFGGADVALDLDWEYGAVRVWVGEHSIQIWEIGHQRAFATSDDAFSIKKNDQTQELGVKPPGDDPNASGTFRYDKDTEVLDPSGETVTPSAEPWKRLAWVLVRVGIPTAVAVKCARTWSQATTRGRKALSDYRARQSGAETDKTITPVSVKGGLWQVLKTLGLACAGAVAFAPFLGAFLFGGAGLIGLIGTAAAWFVAAALVCYLLVDGVGALVPRLSRQALRALGPAGVPVDFLFGAVLRLRDWGSVLSWIGLVYVAVGGPHSAWLLGKVASWVPALAWLTKLTPALEAGTPGLWGYYNKALTWKLSSAKGAAVLTAVLGMLAALWYRHQTRHKEWQEQTKASSPGTRLLNGLVLPLLRTAVGLGMVAALAALGLVTLPATLLGAMKVLLLLMVGTFIGDFFTYQFRENAPPARRTVLASLSPVVGFTLLGLLIGGLTAAVPAALNWLIGETSAWKVINFVTDFSIKSGAIKVLGLYALVRWGTAFWRRVIKPIFRKSAEMLPGQSAEHLIQSPNPTAPDWVNRNVRPQVEAAIAGYPTGSQAADADLFFNHTTEGKDALDSAGFATIAELQQAMATHPTRAEPVIQAMERWVVEQQDQQAAQAAVAAGKIKPGRGSKLIQALRRVVGLSAPPAGLEEFRLTRDEADAMDEERIRIQATVDTERYLRKNASVFGITPSGSGPHPHLSRLMADTQRRFRVGGYPAPFDGAETAEEMVNYFAFRRDWPEFIVHLDRAGRIERGIDMWTFREAIEAMKLRPGKDAATFQIRIQPKAWRGDLIGSVKIGKKKKKIHVPEPVGYAGQFSQGIQYPIAAGYRVQGGWGTNVLSLWAGRMESGAEQSLWTFLLHQLTRWGEGHKGVTRYVYMGKTFHRDPLAAWIAAYDQGIFGGGVRDLILARLHQGTRVGRAAAYTAAAPMALPRNRFYGTGMGPRFEYMIRRRWDDGVDHRELPARDSDAFGPDTFGPRIWGVRQGLHYDWTLVYTPWSYRVEGGRIVSAGEPGKFALHFNPSGWSPELSLPTKAFDLGTFFTLAIQAQSVVPFARRATDLEELEEESSSAGGPEVRLDFLASSPEQEHFLEVDAAREIAVARDHGKRPRATKIHLYKSPMMYSDGRIYRGHRLPSQASGLRLVGPISLGADRYASAYARRWLRPMIRFVDILTLRRWTCTDPEDGMIVRAAKRVAQALYGTTLSPTFLTGVTLIVLWLAGFTFPWWTVFVIAGLLATNRKLIEELLRLPNPAAMWRERKTAALTAIQLNFTARGALRLVKMGTGRRLSPTLAEEVTVLGETLHPRSAAGHQRLVELGRGLLDHHGLWERANRLAGARSVEDLEQNEAKPGDFDVPDHRFLDWLPIGLQPFRWAEGWTQTHARTLRKGLRKAGIRPGSGEFLAVQEALIDLIKIYGIARGNRRAGDLHAGTSDPNVDHAEVQYEFGGEMRQSVPLRSFVAYVHQLTGGKVNLERTFRSWRTGNTGPAIDADPLMLPPEDLPTPPAITIPEDKVDGETATQTGLEESDPVAQFMEGYYGHPSVDDTRRTAAWDGADVIAERLGGGRLLLSPTARNAGMIQPGIIPNRLVVLDRVLYEGAKLLDQPERPGWGWCFTRGLNRVLGVLGSAAAGVGVALGWKAIFLGLAGLAGLPLSGTVAAVAGGVIGGYAGIKGIQQALFGQRWDQWVVGWPEPGLIPQWLTDGEGIRAIASVPGRAFQVPLLFLLKQGWTWLRHNSVYVGGGVRMAPNIAPVIPISLLEQIPLHTDMAILQKLAGLPSEAFLGYVHHMAVPLLVGTGYAPGSALLRKKVASKVAGRGEAYPIPFIATEWLRKQHPAWRVLSAFNYLPSLAWDLLLALAEDTVFGWMMAFHLSPKRLTAIKKQPLTPAQTLLRKSYLLFRWEEIRDEQDGLQGALQFIYGMDLNRALTRLEPAADRLADAKEDVADVVEDDLLADMDEEVLAEVKEDLTRIRALSAEERLTLYASQLAVMKAFEHDEVASDDRKGAGLPSYLFTDLTLHPLYSKLAQIFAPGQLEALLVFQIYEVVDEIWDGALTKQIFKMNQEQDGNRLTGAALAGNRLSDLEVQDQLVRGSAIDPRGAMGAVKAQIHGAMMDQVREYLAKEGRTDEDPEEVLAAAAFQASEDLKELKQGPRHGANWGGLYGKHVDGTRTDDDEAAHAEAVLKEFSDSRYGQWLSEAVEDFEPMSGAGQTVDITGISVRLLSEKGSGRYIMKPTNDVLPLQKVNDILSREGKTGIILPSQAVLEQAKSIIAFPVGGVSPTERRLSEINRAPAPTGLEEGDGPFRDTPPSSVEERDVSFVDTSPQPQMPVSEVLQVAVPQVIPSRSAPVASAPLVASREAPQVRASRRLEAQESLRAGFERLVPMLTDTDTAVGIGPAEAERHWEALVQLGRVSGFLPEAVKGRFFVVAPDASRGHQLSALGLNASSDPIVVVDRLKAGLTEATLNYYATSEERSGLEEAVLLLGASMTVRLARDDSGRTGIRGILEKIFANLMGVELKQFRRYVNLDKIVEAVKILLEA